MSKRSVQLVVLVEDIQHRAFITRLLKALGFLRLTRVVSPPVGKGSAEQYVREHYAEEVRELRRRSGHLHQGLVVMIDADDKEISERLQQLENELVKASLQKRGLNEQIAILIPRRNIMTWIEWLLGKQVNEQDTYPELKGRERQCQPAVTRLVQLYRSGNPLPADCPPSLLTAINELRRLE